MATIKESRSKEVIRLLYAEKMRLPDALAEIDLRYEEFKRYLGSLPLGMQEKVACKIQANFFLEMAER